MRSTDAKGKQWEPLPDEAKAELAKIFYDFAWAKPTPTPQGLGYNTEPQGGQGA